jgi:hypothetical protein
VKVFVLICLAQLACACTPHGARCDGHLKPINAGAGLPGAASATAAGAPAGVP